MGIDYTNLVALHGQQKVVPGLTSIIILSYNTLDYTRACIESIRKYTPDDSYELIVVDNGSNDGSVNWLSKQSDIICVFNHKNLGFPKGCNQGLALASGEDLLLLNSDTLVTPHWLDNLRTALYSNDAIGAVGPVTDNCSNIQAINRQFKTQNDMEIFAEKFNISNPDKWHTWLVLIGFCLLFKRCVYDSIGGLDEKFSSGNFEDDDYCFRIRLAGWEILLCEDTFIHHYGSVSFDVNKNNLKDEMLIRNRRYIYNKYDMPEYEYKLVNDGALKGIAKEARVGSSILILDCMLGYEIFWLQREYKSLQLKCTGLSSWGVAEKLYYGSLDMYYQPSWPNNEPSAELIRGMDNDFDIVFWTGNIVWSEEIHNVIKDMAKELLREGGRFYFICENKLQYIIK